MIAFKKKPISKPLLTSPHILLEAHGFPYSPLTIAFGNSKQSCCQKRIFCSRGDRKRH